MIIIASTALTVMHPGIGFGKEAWQARDWHYRTRNELKMSGDGVLGEENDSGSGDAMRE